VIVRRASAILAVLILAACSSGTDHTTPQSRATIACRAAVKHPATVVSAMATTVGEIHAITGGERGMHPWSNLYAGAPRRSFAAWCWRRSGGNRYQSFVIGPGAPIFLNVTTSDPLRPGPLPVT
jgi:hypothetical protein